MSATLATYLCFFGAPLALATIACLGITLHGALGNG